MIDDQIDQFYNPNNAMCRKRGRDCACSTGPIIKVYRNDKCPECPECPECPTCPSPKECPSRSELCAGMVAAREADLAHQQAMKYQKLNHVYVILGLAVLIFVVLALTVYSAMERSQQKNKEENISLLNKNPMMSGIKVDSSLAREASKSLPGLVEVKGKKATYFPPLIPIQ